MRRKQTLERELKLTPNFSLSEMRVAFSPLLGTAFEHIVSLQFLSSSFVAAFHGLDSDARNGVCFSGSRQAHEIIKPEAPHSHAALLSIRSDALWINKWPRLFANASSEGERCMKDTDHPLRHPLRHHRIFGRVPNKRRLRMAQRSIWACTKHRIGLERPPFCARFRAQIIRGVAPAQLRGDRAEYFVRVQMRRRTTSKTVCNHPNS